MISWSWCQKKMLALLPHNGGVNLVLPVLEHSLLGGFLFVVGLLQLDLENTWSVWVSLVLTLHVPDWSWSCKERWWSLCCRQICPHHWCLCLLVSWSALSPYRRPKTETENCKHENKRYNFSTCRVLLISPSSMLVWSFISCRDNSSTLLNCIKQRAAGQHC